MPHFTKTRSLTLILIFFGFIFISGCLAVGNFSPSLNKGENIIIQDENFTEDIDLTQELEFHPSVPGVMKAVVDGNMVFKNCQFYKFSAHTQRDGKTYIIEFRGDVVFDGCTFRDSARFDYAIFQGSFYAESSEFMEMASFSNAHFEGRNTIFSQAVFYSKARFPDATFANDVKFFKTRFHDTAMFQSAVFKGHSFWGASEFKGYAGFGKTRFFQELDMAKTEFGDRSNFNGLFAFLPAYFNEASFAETADFSKANFLQGINTEEAEFAKSVKGVSTSDDNQE